MKRILSNLAVVATGAALLAAPAMAAPAAAPTPFVPTADMVNKGDVAWMMVSTALVLMMSVPALALFYGGLVRAKNMLSVLMQVLTIVCVAALVWFGWGYSMAFTSTGTPFPAFVGGLDKAFLKGVSVTSLAATFSNGVYLPELVFVMFQMTFACITPALIVGAFAERVKFTPLIIFVVAWMTLAYFPIAHMVWYWAGPDFLHAAPTDMGLLWGWGALDFAGGTVVHINAGVAGLVCALVLGKRKGYGATAMAPHNLTWSFIGAALLWVGWFGFNAGSAVAANALAGAAMINTQVATAGAAMAWMFAEWIIHKKPSVLGIISGAVAGLVAVTPASGFVNPTGALIIGIVAGVGCYIFAVHLKKMFGYDDSLDAFGVHGIGGIIGALLTGVFADVAVNELGKDASIATQAYGVGVTIVYTAVATAIILYVVKAIIGLRPSEAAEEEGLDITLHGETVQ